MTETNRDLAYRMVREADVSYDCFKNELQRIRQVNEVVRLSDLVRSRSGKSVSVTVGMLEREGYTAAVKRVVFSGGVGSFRWMPRKKVFRLQVAASAWGKPVPNSSFVFRKGFVFRNKKRGKKNLKYALCIEI